MRQSWVRPSNAWITVGIITFGILALRAFLTLTHDGFIGVDGGAYLLHAKRLIGLDLPSIDFNRPALAPGWTLVPFIRTLGDDWGFSLWTAIASTIPIIPAAALLAFRVLPTKKLALIATLFIALNPWHWEMVVTGALPLVGIGFILLALWGLIGIVSGKGTKWDKLAIVSCVAIIPYINQTSTGLAAVALPTFLVSFTLLSRSRKTITRALPWLLMGAFLAIPAILLYYADVVPGGDRMTFPGPKVFIPIGYTAAWLVIAYAYVAGIPTLRENKNVALKAIATVMLVHASLTFFSSYDESIINIFFRSQHIATPLLMIVATSYLSTSFNQMRLSHITQRVIVTLLAVLLIGASAFTFQRQSYYSDMMTPDMLAVLEHVPDNDDSTILTTNFMTGLWVAALEGTPTAWTFSALPPPMWQEQYAHTRCILGWPAADCDPIAAAKAIDVKYVVMDMKFPHITDREPNLWGAPEDTWAPTLAAPWLNLIASEGTVRLWKVNSYG